MAGLAAARELMPRIYALVRQRAIHTGALLNSGCDIIEASDAEIEVGVIIVQGVVTGNIRAKRAVELEAPARVKGNIETPSLFIEKGVIFEGHSKMENLERGSAKNAPSSLDALAAAAGKPATPPAKK